MPKIEIHNVETGEIEIREMNADELAQWEIDKTVEEAKATEAEAKAAARQALLDKLGITEDEAKILLS
jgi:hypothetical protein